MDMLGTVLLYAGSFVAVLSLVVFVHEFGHFQSARWLGVAIDTFSIGFGRTLAQWRDRHGVVWKIGALPLGGYVKFAGDADAFSSASADPIEGAAARDEARRKGLFHAQPVSTRAIVVAAGPFSNFLFSTLVFALILMTLGRDVTDQNRLPPRIDGVMAGSPAAQAGIVAGDLIVAVDGAAIASFGALSEAVAARPGERLALTVRRDGADRVVYATPNRVEGVDATGVKVVVGRLGIQRTTLPEERRIERLGPFSALAAGAGQTWQTIALTGAYVGNILTGKASAEHLAGPAGIMAASGQIAQGALGGPEDDRTLGDRIGGLALSLIQWAALLSVAVGIVNLLPVPILDGGHLLFYGIEAVRGGRPLPARTQEWAFRAGLLMLGSLFLFATWNDVQRHWLDLRNFLG